MFYDCITCLQVFNILEGKKKEELDIHDALKIAHLISPIKKETYSKEEINNLYDFFIDDFNRMTKGITEDWGENEGAGTERTIPYIILETIHQLSLVGVSPVGLTLRDAQRMMHIHNAYIEKQNLQRQINSGN